MGRELGAEVSLENRPVIYPPPGVKCRKFAFCCRACSLRLLSLASLCLSVSVSLSLTHMHTFSAGLWEGWRPEAEPFFFSFLVLFALYSRPSSCLSAPSLWAYLPHKCSFPAGPLNIQTWASKDRACLSCNLPNLPVSLLPFFGGGGRFPGLTPLSLLYRQWMVEGAAGRHIMSDALGFLPAFCQRQGNFRC